MRCKEAQGGYGAVMNPLAQSSTRGTRHLVASADQLAARAGDAIFSKGGNAVDAAIATNAAIAVTCPHLCGLGGDLFALIHDGHSVHALNSSGRAGSGANADQLRAEGLTTLPFRHDIRVVSVPGCIDGWVALNERFGSMPLAEVIQPAIDLAEYGFPASPLLVGAVRQLDNRGAEALHELSSQATSVGAVVRRPGVARALRAVASGGRDGFYLGEFGQGLKELGNGLFHDRDLEQSSAEWVTPLTSSAFGVDLHTIPPNSQGYLTLGAASMLDGIDLGETDDDRWAQLTIEASKVAGFDRPQVLGDRADGNELLAAIAARRDLLNVNAASKIGVRSTDGDTTYLCTAEADGYAVSLIQSNAAGFGCWLAEPNTQINLHNRGLGFSLEPGHPAVFGPGRRPPHTLSPALATRDSEFVSVFGTMGGDAQPQILLQIAARLFQHQQSPAEAIHAARWALAGPTSGFDTWDDMSQQQVLLEGHSPSTWRERLTARGHRIRVQPEWDSTFGHAHAIVRDEHGLAGAADPRARVSACLGR